MVSMYCRPTEEIALYIDRLERILRVLRSQRIIIYMDLNARSGRWGDCINDGRADQLLDLIELQGLAIINDGRQGPTFSNVRGSSYIDLTLTTADLRDHTRKWRIHELSLIHI